VVTLSAQPPLPPGNIPGINFFYRLSRSQDRSAAGRIKAVKIPLTPLGIEPATFRLVAQCFKQPRHCVPGSRAVRFNKCTHTYSHVYVRTWLYIHTYIHS
jgi:hypothetical protein